MYSAIVYETASGRIISNMEVSRLSLMDIQVFEGQSWIESTGNPDTHYVFDDIVVDRPTVEPVTGSRITTEGYPEGTVIEIENNAGDVADTSDPEDPEVRLDPGPYLVRIRPPFPNQPLDHEHEVPDA